MLYQQNEQKIEKRISLLTKVTLVTITIFYIINFSFILLRNQVKFVLIR